ncbi:hypothetical protein [Moorena bouillonii]|uniref:Uncharacterized protein n=1 Tax=Moorena bouillonii PNG TaxID=568701 RepID=A0A1U7N4N0_9CYAN|nr:hypothetical protein [Moorena bouillonii]NEO51084.1 hypothetical protein [Moorena sp. SIO4A3]OLT60895.1 hypothetical protein BJP37_19640 [Moorena bouillonii PNG]
MRVQPANLQPANLQPSTKTNLQPSTKTNLGLLATLREQPKLTFNLPTLAKRPRVREQPKLILPDRI